MTRPTFFATPDKWRAWLDTHHDTETELLVGFHKVASGKPSITYHQALDEALAYGWIDGRRTGGETSYTIRFTPRRKGSIWSAVNKKRIAELKAEGRMHEAGLAEFANRDTAKEKLYSHENRDVRLDPAYEKAFRADKKAWADFEKRSPTYRRQATWWVMSAKQEATRDRRLRTLIADSAAGRKIKPLTPPQELKKRDA